MRKVTKEEMDEILKTQDPTKIFQLAKIAGVNIEDRINLLHFIEKNAPNKEVFKNAYDLSFGAGDFKNYRVSGFNSYLKMEIADAVNYLKHQVKNGSMSTNYGKILIEGKSNIYWASPVYQHSDYNKTIAMKNCKKNRRVMKLINSILMK